MLKIVKDNKKVAVLKDDASEPEILDTTKETDTKNNNGQNTSNSSDKQEKE